MHHLTVICGFDDVLDSKIWRLGRRYVRLIADTYVIKPEIRIKNTKNIVNNLIERNENIALLTNDPTTVSVINACIYSFQCKDETTYPKLDPKYVEAYTITDGKKVNIKCIDGDICVRCLEDPVFKLKMDIIGLRSKL
jgi:hypothetical protein